MILLQITDVVTDTESIQSALDVLKWVCTIQFLAIIAMSCYIVYDKNRTFKAQMKIQEKNITALEKISVTLDHLYDYEVNSKN